MKIAVFGLGYVGIVSAACLASQGHDLVGVDVNPEKVEAVNSGRSTVLEDDIGAMVHDVVGSGRPRATTSAAEAIAATSLAFVCVGTPSSPSGALSTEYLERVAEEIGAALPRDRRYVVVLRSTVLPGTSESVVLPLLEQASGMKVGDGFAFASHPEFLREGSSVRDFFDPPKTVIGTSDPLAAGAVRSLYEGIESPVFEVPVRVAEMLKYVDNSFHALKVGFANEVGALCKALGVDSYSVMEIFKADTKLNISTAYLTPGFAFGGSCLPKDLRALVHRARHADVSVPILEAVLPSNDLHLERAFDLVESTGFRRVGIFGLAFKDGTDDLRESPMVRLAERLLGRGYELSIHDAHVANSRLFGANRAYADEHIPHLTKLLRSSPDEVLANADVCVIGSRAPEVLQAVAGAGVRPVIDLVRVGNEGAFATYEGISW